MAINVTAKAPVEKMRNSFPDAYQKSNGWWTHDDNPRFDFLETPEGNIIIHSWTGRTIDDVLSKGTPPLKQADLFAKTGTWSSVQKRDKLDLLTLSNYLKIDWKFLEQQGYRDGYKYTNDEGRDTVCVKLGGYCHPDGREYSKNKVRLTVDPDAKGARFLWDKHTPGPQIPCGLHHLEGARDYLIMGEGESDWITCLFHGIPFLGIGGSQAIKSLDVSLLAGIPRIYIIEEPDQAEKLSMGAGFYKNVHMHLRSGGYTGEIFSIRWKDATGCKDPSELHKTIHWHCKQETEGSFRAEVKQKFAEAVKKAMDCYAIPEGNDGLDTPYQEIEPEAPPMPGSEGARIAWIEELLAVNAGILSPSQKITLIILVLHMHWFDPVQGWRKVDTDHLAKIAAQSKGTFLSNLAYLNKNVHLFEKRPERIEYEGVNGKTNIRTDLYIQPASGSCLTFPSTYHIAEGKTERKHGGKQQPADKPKCERCGSEHIDYTCLDCDYTNLETQHVESTAQVLALQESPIGQLAPSELDGDAEREKFLREQFAIARNSAKVADFPIGQLASSENPDESLDVPTGQVAPPETSEEVLALPIGQLAPSIDTIYIDRQLAPPETPDESLDVPIGQLAPSETAVDFGCCSTTFEMNYSEPHGVHPGTMLDNAGNAWCQNCPLQRELINIGYARGYPQVGTLKAGQYAWLKFARTRGYNEVRTMLASLGWKGSL